jgi:threonine dehydrogenase-like Zn-dependent dehydrogenase
MDSERSSLLFVVPKSITKILALRMTLSPRRSEDALARIEKGIPALNNEHQAKLLLKAAVLTEYKKIEIEDVPEPQIGPHDVEFRVMACGLCPNDYRLYTGLATWKKLPAVLGHEPAGEVVKVGSEVNRFKPGDMVAGDITTRCGYCRSCAAGRENLCPNRKNVVDGSLAQFSAGNEIWMNKFHHVSFEEASLVEPLSCVLNGIRNSRVKAGDIVAIVGAGQIGLMLLQVAQMLRAKVIVIDVRSDRLSVAERLGAEYVIDSSTTDPVARVKELTAGDGANAAIVAIGNKQAIETGFHLVGPMGTVNLFASTNPPTDVSINPNVVHRDEVSVIGSYDKTRADLQEATRLVDEGRIDVKTLITHIYDLEHSADALSSMGKGEGIKLVIKPNGRT